MGPSEERMADLPPRANKGETGYFTYTDGNGVQVIVERLADVPTKYRADVGYIDLSKPPVKVADVGARPVPAQKAGNLCLGEGACLHITSFLLGAAAALVLGGAGLLLFRRSLRLLGVLAGIVLVAALTVALLTYARSEIGLQPKGLVTPKVLVDEARATVKAVDEHHRTQAHSIDEIEK
jgi:hypothetical protein